MIFIEVEVVQRLELGMGLSQRQRILIVDGEVAPQRHRRTIRALAGDGSCRRSRASTWCFPDPGLRFEVPGPLLQPVGVADGQAAEHGRPAGNCPARLPWRLRCGRPPTAPPASPADFQRHAHQVGSFHIRMGPARRPVPPGQRRLRRAPEPYSAQPWRRPRPPASSGDRRASLSARAGSDAPGGPFITFGHTRLRPRASLAAAPCGRVRRRARRWRGGVRPPSRRPPRARGSCPRPGRCRHRRSPRHAHALARRRRAAGDEADHRLAHLVAMNSAARSSSVPPISPIITTASVAGLGLEHLRHVDERRAVDRVAADADAGRHAQAAGFNAYGTS